MKEEFLQAIWQYRLFDFRNLLTQDGETVQILHPGRLNRDSGPDFFDARIKIGTTLWAGNVEIHLRESDWNKHGHHKDKAYDNIILHVVLQADGNGSNDVPVLELSPYLDTGLFQKYREIIESISEIPCSKFLHSVDPVHFETQIERMMVTRIENKCANINHTLKQTSGNWEEAFYRSLAINFGFHTNSSPFGLLAIHTPQQVLARQKHKREQLEALLFGQAGFLEDKIADGYYQGLKEEYRHLKRKYDLQPMPVHLWKFLRTRPANFPTLRISQFAALIHKSSNLLSKCLEIEELHELQKLFDVEASVYWKSHSRFGAASGPLQTHLGANAFHLIAINTVAPFLFHYGQHHSDDDMAGKALRLLSQIPPEDNKIMRKWTGLGKKPRNAAESQALLELYKSACLKKQCLHCSVGLKVVSCKA